LIHSNGIVDLSTDRMKYRLNVSTGVSATEYGLTDRTPLVNDMGSGLACEFAFDCEGAQIDGGSRGLVPVQVEDIVSAPGARHVTIRFRYDPKELEVRCHYLVYENTALVEKWVDIRNAGDKPVMIGRIDSFVLPLTPGDWSVMYYKSDWGAEFEPVREPLTGGVLLETRFGRSSKGMHPWMTLFSENGDGELLTISPMWSGNWILRCEPAESGGYKVSGGLHDWEFFKELQPGQQVEGVHVAMALGEANDLDTTAVQFARVGRQYWYPRNEFSDSLPVEWNHWWSYEDKDVNENNFLANAEAAARLGMDICTLDAGWFGPSKSEAEWYEYRGDWGLVNTVRFPGGLQSLSDGVHNLGLNFGLWCEIEAAGKHAALAEHHPGFIARRDGVPLGYVCFGNREAQEWACRTLERLITEYRCNWIKLDFNLDPYAGCNCTDHGHGAGDGLYEHYRGYYSVLDRIRESHPNIILENCASGGLRIDLGIMRHTHLTFLSDPDWPEHSLQVFWGATTMLAPNACLHWSYSDWRGGHPSQRFNPRDPNLTDRQFDYFTRISMLRGFGFSQKLNEMPERLQNRISHHVQVYKETVKRFIRDADLYRLTGQPKREGRGDRWTAFQYRLRDGGENLLFVFRLPKSEESRTICLKYLDAEAEYKVISLSDGVRETRSGRELMERGLHLAHLAEEESELLMIRRIG
jgi:alpha-galactosidase